MRKLFFIMALMLVSIAVSAQKEGDKGPLTVETPYFKVDVPKGWHIKSIMNKEVPCWLTICPDKDPRDRGNFGFSVEIRGGKYNTVKEETDNAMGQFGAGKTKRMPDYKVGNKMMTHTFFDGGNGSCQKLITPLSKEGALTITLNEFALKDKDIKTILKGLVIK